ncbi:MAG: DUF3108 domain-containing protein [Bacteroidetes bacterium]|nr:DUF3108 domain-containing protein [Bacteroidota bacterium]
MKTLYTTFILFFTAFQLQGATRDSALLPYNVFKAKEKLTYTVRYKWNDLWLSAGTIDFEVSNKKVKGEDYLELDVYGRTAPGFDLFYKVRDHYISVINPKTLLPFVFARDVNEGGFRIFNKYVFNHDSSNVESETEDTKNPLASDIYTIPNNAQDLVSCLYYARNINIAGADSGKIFPINLFLDNKNYKIGIRYLGKEKVITDLGEFVCIVAQPLLLEGRVFDETDQMRIYVTDDERRMPIMVESPLKVGKIMAMLVEYK